MPLMNFGRFPGNGKVPESGVLQFRGFRWFSLYTANGRSS